MSFLTWRPICQRKMGEFEFCDSDIFSTIVLFLAFVPDLLSSFQIVLKFGPGKCERYAAQQPSQVSQTWAGQRFKLSWTFPNMKSLFSQVCIQRWIRKVQTLYDYNTNGWCCYMPLPSQLSVSVELQWLYNLTVNLYKSFWHMDTCYLLTGLLMKSSTFYWFGTIAHWQ